MSKISALKEIVELQERSKGVWYARALFEMDDETEESFFVKFRSKEEPSHDFVVDSVGTFSESYNRRDEPIRSYPEEVEEEPKKKPESWYRVLWTKVTFWTGF